MLHRLVRPLVGYTAIACALPYLALKIIWLAGGELGVANADMMRDARMVALNVVTAGMDLVGIAIALAFTHAWSQRLPAWPLLPPAWVAMGLLVRFVLAVPLIAIARLLTLSGTPAMASGVAAPSAAGPVQSWVYVLVCGEFVGLGIGLSLAFVLDEQVRWCGVFRPVDVDALQARSDAMTPDATRDLQLVGVDQHPRRYRPGPRSRADARAESPHLGATDRGPGDRHRHAVPAFSPAGPACRNVQLSEWTGRADRYRERRQALCS
jgi:hypothetical protein